MIFASKHMLWALLFKANAPVSFLESGFNPTESYSSTLVF